MDGRNTRREEPQGPLPLDSVAGSAAEGKTVGRGETGRLLNADRLRALERGDRMEGLLREVIRQALMDRVEPRWKRLEELKAEPRWPRKGRR